MRIVVGMAVAVLLLAGCGGDDDPPTLREWLVDDDGGQVDPDNAECVADRLSDDLSDDQVDRLVRLDTSGWSEADYVEHGDLMEPLAAATFACVTGSLSEG